MTESSNTIPTSDDRLQTLTGIKRNNVIELRNAPAGCALYGGYVNLPVGSYRAVIWLEHAPKPEGRGTIEVCVAAASYIVTQADFDCDTLSREAPFVDLYFKLWRGAEDLEVRLLGTDGLTMQIRSVEIISMEPKPRRPSSRPTQRGPQRRPLNILYYSCHEILEYDEMRMLTNRGHRVFSMNGYFGDPDKPGHARPSLPQFYHPGDWARYKLEGLSRSFAAQFDLVIVMSHPEWVAEIASALPDIPIIYRSIGQSNPDTESRLAPYRDRVRIVRYSRREEILPGFLSSDATIYFGKYLGDFYTPWIGGGNILTFHNNYAFRDAWSVPNLAMYQEVTATHRADLGGFGNEGLSNSKGAASSHAQIEMYRLASVYLYVYTVAPSYTLSFMEAMATGLPILAPTAEMILQSAPATMLQQSGFTKDRYEVEELLGNDERLLYSSIPEAKEKLYWLLQNRDYCVEVSRRLRGEFSATFDAEVVADQWESFLFGVVAASV